MNLRRWRCLVVSAAARSYYQELQDAGVLVFLCDVKGDVAGICAPGVSSEGMEKRIDRFGLRGEFVQLVELAQSLQTPQNVQVRAD